MHNPMKILVPVKSSKPAKPEPVGIAIYNRQASHLTAFLAGRRTKAELRAHRPLWTKHILYP